MLQFDVLCGDIILRQAFFLTSCRRACGGQPPPKGPDASESKAQEAADIKKKGTDLAQARAVGLPVPASAAGETFSDVPAPPWAVPAAPEWKNGGKAAPSDPYLVPPL